MAPPTERPRSLRRLHGPPFPIVAPTVTRGLSGAAGEFLPPRRCGSAAPLRQSSISTPNRGAAALMRFRISAASFFEYFAALLSLLM